LVTDAFFADAAEDFRDAVIQQMQRNGFVIPDCVEQFFRSAMPRKLSAEHLVEDDSEAPDIGTFIEKVRFPLQLFGGHIAGRSGREVCLKVFAFGWQKREAEVGEPDFTSVIDQDVAGFEISMEAAVAMQPLKDFAELYQQGDSIIDWQATGVGLEELGKVTARYVAHHDNGQTAVLEQVVNGNDATVTEGAVDGGCTCSFANQFFATATEERISGPRQLQSPVDSELGIEGQQNTPKSPFTDESFNLKPADDGGQAGERISQRSGLVVKFSDGVEDFVDCLGLVGELFQVVFGTGIFARLLADFDVLQEETGKERPALLSGDLCKVVLEFPAATGVKIAADFIKE
jgi:hypothetical protein